MQVFHTHCIGELLDFALCSRMCAQCSKLLEGQHLFGADHQYEKKYCNSLTGTYVKHPRSTEIAISII